MRAKIVGTASRPRLSIFRSNRFMYGQVIDDTTRHTLLGVHTRNVSSEQKVKKQETKSDSARAAGRELARLALEKQIKHIIFDRGGYRYQGRVRAFAEGAREGGLVF